MSGNFCSIRTSPTNDKLIQLFKLNFVVGIPGIGIRILICFLQLLHHVTFPFAATFGFILIYAKVFSNVILVYEVINNRNGRHN